MNYLQFMTKPPIKILQFLSLPPEFLQLSSQFYNFYFTNLQFVTKPPPEIILHFFSNIYKYLIIYFYLFERHLRLFEIIQIFEKNGIIYFYLFERRLRLFEIIQIFEKR